MGKIAPLTGDRKDGKGGIASEQTPHPSSCPPPAADRRRSFRCSAFSHTNRFAGFAWEPCPICKPLKTTKKGAAAPFLGFFPEFGSCRDRFRLAKRVTDAYLLNWRSSRNTLRLFRLLYVKYLPHFDFEMQKLPRPPEGRLDDGPCNDKTQNGTTRFFCA